MKRKLICIAIITTILSSSILSGCNGSDTSETEDTSKTSTDITADGGNDTEEATTDANFNETGFPIVNEPITLTVFGSRDQNQAEWKDVFVLQEYEKMTNVIMDYQEVPASGFAEKKNLLFASNEMPDIFLRSALEPHEIGLYGVTSGQLIPIDDLMDKYAPNLSALYNEYPLIRSSIKASDGQTYGVYPMNTSKTGMMGFKQWINKDWLEALGLQMPKTLDEFKEVLIAFRDNDPNGNGEADEIPLGIREPNSIFSLGGNFGLEHQMYEPINIDENGKIHYWLTDDRYKEYLMWLNELYEEKLIWQDYYKNDRPAWRANLSNAQFGIFYMPYSDVFLNVEEQFTGLEPIPGPYGDNIWADANSVAEQNAAFAISNTCQYPEVAMRWVDYFYSQEGSMFFRYGVEGQTYTYDEEGTPRFNDDILNSEEGFMTALGKINLVPGGAFPVLITDETDGVVASDLTKEVAALMAPYLPEKVYIRPSVSADDNERLNAIDQDLTNYRDEAATKFIIGEWDFDKWEDYCKAIEQIGVFEKEEILQRALDAQQN